MKLFAKQSILIPLFSASVAFATSGNTIGNAGAPSNSKVNDMLNEIVSIMLWLAIVIAIFKILQIGIMFITAPASKAKAKESIFPWLIGLVVCVLAQFIGPQIINFFKDSGIGDKGPFDI